MQDSIKLFVVLLEAEELSANFSEWPKSISLAVCLLPTGEHHFVAFHADEFSEICPRLEHQLRLSRNEFSVFPEISGYQFRSMLFSETQLIWTLVAETDEVLEEAVDYSENYRFAKEEGLEPTLFLGLEPRIVQVCGGEFQEATERTVRQDTSVLQFASQRLHTKNNTDISCIPPSDSAAAQLPSFLLPHQARPIPGYVNVCELKERYPTHDHWTVHLEKDGWILVECVSQGDIDLQVNEKSQLFLQKTQQKLAVRLEAVLGQSPKIPNRIRFKADIIPEPILEAMASRKNVVKFSLLGYFLYLTIEPDPSFTEFSSVPPASLQCDIELLPLLKFKRNNTVPLPHISNRVTRKNLMQSAVGVASLVLTASAAAIYLSDDAQAGVQVETRSYTQQLFDAEPAGNLRYIKNSP